MRRELHRLAAAWYDAVKEASMRILLLIAAAALLPQPSTAAPAGAEAAENIATIPKPAAALPNECRRPTDYKADNSLSWRGEGLKPRKLTELPPATGYMAVYRVTNGCEDPMTMVEYRTGRRR
jgi:hypothetical protein